MRTTGLGALSRRHAYLSILSICFSLFPLNPDPLVSLLSLSSPASLVHDLPLHSPQTLLWLHLLQLKAFKGSLLPTQYGPNLLAIKTLHTWPQASAVLCHSCPSAQPCPVYSGRPQHAHAFPPPGLFFALPFVRNVLLHFSTETVSSRPPPRLCPCQPARAPLKA